MKDPLSKVARVLMIFTFVFASSLAIAQTFTVKLATVQVAHNPTTGALTGGWLTIQSGFGNAGSLGWNCSPPVLYIPNDSLPTFYAAYATALNAKARDTAIRLTIEQYSWTYPPFGGVICEVKNMKLEAVGS